MKDYKKILEGMVNIITSENSDVVANIRAYIDENCPELKEDEDERIIKALKEGFKYHQLFNPTFGGIPCKEIVNWLEKQGKKRKITHEEICKSYGISDIGEFSDGYHTFNSLYKQRMILFAVLVKTYKDRAWKSWKHEDGLDCFGGGWFIVGIDTPAGTYTYHYEAKDWDRFDCRILDKAKHWDGHDEFDVERLFSLLEKQGGQKPFDYENANIQQKDFAPIEPKFHEGDWLVQENIGVYKVIEICESWYEVIDGEDNHYSISFDKEHMCHLWAIEDAKDGDVLVTVDDKCPFIYKGCLDPKHPNSPVAYCGIDTEDFFSIGGDKFNHWWTDEEVQPSTKEQRYILFQKMEEAGYEWDADKKELKKIEQKIAW